MAHSCNPSTWEVEARWQEFMVLLHYTGNYRSVCATTWITDLGYTVNPAWKTNGEKNKKQKERKSKFCFVLGFCLFWDEVSSSLGRFGSSCVAEAVLELWPSCLHSLNARILNLCHHTWPKIFQCIQNTRKMGNLSRDAQFIVSQSST